MSKIFDIKICHVLMRSRSFISMRTCIGWMDVTLVCARFVGINVVGIKVNKEPITMLLLWWNFRIKRLEMSQRLRLPESVSMCYQPGNVGWTRRSIVSYKLLMWISVGAMAFDPGVV